MLTVPSVYANISLHALQHNNQKLSTLNRSLGHNPILLSYIRSIWVFEDRQRVHEESTLMLPARLGRWLSLPASCRRCTCSGSCGYMIGFRMKVCRKYLEDARSPQ
jgi:hypothetical protein